MKQLINSTRKRYDERQRTAVLRLEMNYELATLFDAMNDSDTPKMKECKQTLERIRQELIRLKAL